jgi:Domain of unknown function (DUF4124)
MTKRVSIVAVRAGLALLAGLGLACAVAQTLGPGQIYSCTDANGKKLTSDRPIVECNSREQRVLNADGSVKRVVPPTPTADERSAIEARELDAAADRAHKQEAIRRDRNLLARFPNEAAHKKAREASLEDVRKAVRLSESRLAALATERKPLMDETEFYVGRPMPAKLKMQLDANDASADAQRSLLQNQQLEVVRIDKLYDAELERLRKLWSGAQPGSMGMLAGAAASAPPRK